LTGHDAFRCNRLHGALARQAVHVIFTRVRIRHISTLALALATALAVTPPAHADRVDDLAKVLEVEKDDKARIAAAVSLGRLGDERAVPPLIRALGDKSPVVRGVAASALGHIGDARAIAPLERLLSDPSDAVRARAREALQLIREKQARAAGGGRAVDPNDQAYVTPKERPLMRGGASAAPRLLVTVKSTANKTTTGGKGMSGKLREYMLAALRDTPDVTLDEKTADGAAAFVIDGAITTMRKSTTAKYVELRCEVQFSIANKNGRILSIVTGGATMQVPKGAFKPQLEQGLWLQVLENAVRGAHQNMVAYMARQVASN
jgi:hypothetical protein